VLRRLREIHSELGTRSVIELYHEAQQHWSEGHALFALGQLGLRQRARLDDLYYAIVNDLKSRLKPEERSHRQALDELNEKLVDKYFVNFSIFESIPDAWAIDQIFPIVPITGLDRAPDRRGVIADLTCDSDGRIDAYVDADGVDVSLPLHSPQAGKPYRLGIFLVGAYQEALGDIHNLFGDTDAVNVRLTDSGYAFSHVKRGDTTDVMLDYVGYKLDELRAAYRGKIAASQLSAGDAERVSAALEAGLTGYTYLVEN
jgi:arginine decarboxylase